MHKLGFYVLAPERQIERGIFDKHMDREHIEKTVKRRADEYDTSKNLWFNKKFQSIIDKIDIGIISWEEIIVTIQKYDPAFHGQIQEFYNLCLHFNSAGRF